MNQAACAHRLCRASLAEAQRAGSRQILISHLLQRVVAPLPVMVSQPASAGLLDQWIHP